MTGTFITLTDPAHPDAGGMDAYVAAPAGEIRGGIIVIHEMWGLQDHTRDVADRFAAEGYLAVAPDVLSNAGIDPSTGAELQRLRYHASEEERVREQPRLRDAFSAARAPEYTAWAISMLRRAVDLLTTTPGVEGRIAVTGFCFGGGLSFQLAATDPRVRASIPFYGAAPDRDTLARIEVPMLALYGSADEPLMATLPKLERDAQDVGADFESVVYPGAKHAFFNDTNVTTYDRAAAADAFVRVLAFLREKLTGAD